MDDELGRADLEALAATRRDLGADYEPALLEAFAERVERVVEQRVDSAVESAQRARHEHQRLANTHGTRQLILAVASVVACVPLVLALALNDQLPSLVVALLAILGINAAHASAGPAKER